MKKMYYIPGIFSIILLPVLGIWYMNKYDYFQKLSAHDFNYIDFNSVREWRKKDFIYPAYEYDKRVYKELTLNGNYRDSQKTFNYIDQFVNDIIQNKDTINGLKVHFDKKSTYNEFIHLLNIFEKRGAEMYLLDNNTMYFVGKDWSPIEESEIDFDNLVHFTCGSGYYNERDEQTFNIRKELNNLKFHFLQNKVIYSAYFLFFIFAVVSFTIRYKKRL